MKNHEWVDGRLLQTNKKYSQLKLKQKERIHDWMYREYKASYRKIGKYPDAKSDDTIIQKVMEQIEAADIWIPYREVEKHYRSVKGNLKKSLNKELRKEQLGSIVLESLDCRFTICKVADYSVIDMMQPFCFTGATDEEYSLVCPEEFVPENTTDRDDGWKALRISGQLEFSLIGILARISKILASNEIGIFAVSTYNTDYIFVKEEDFDKARMALKSGGYGIKGQ